MRIIVKGKIHPDIYESAIITAAYSKEGKKIKKEMEKKSKSLGHKHK